MVLADGHPLLEAPKENSVLLSPRIVFHTRDTKKRQRIEEDDMIVCVQPARKSTKGKKKEANTLVCGFNMYITCSILLLNRGK